LPLEKIFASQRSSNDEYQQKCPSAYSRIRRARHSLRVRRYFSRRFEEVAPMKIWQRSGCAASTDWKMDSRELIREFLELKFGTIICCVNDAHLGEESLAGTLMKNLFAYCRRVLIRAAKMANFIPSPSPGRFFNSR